MLRNFVAKKCCDFLLWYFVVEFCCGILLRHFVAEFCCGILLQNFVVEFCRGILLQNCVKSETPNSVSWVSHSLRWSVRRVSLKTGLFNLLQKTVVILILF